MDIIVNKLNKLKDDKYKEFNAKLIPNIDKENIIGIRLPDIRKIAKEIKDYEYTDDFLNELPHVFQEEYILHGILLSYKYKDIYVLLDKLDVFLEYTNSWIITDTISPKLFKKYPDIVYEYIVKWVMSNSEYKIRFGIVSLLQFYLDDNYDKKIFKLVNSVKYDSYYVNMAIAWFYSFALIKKWDDTIKIFEKKKLKKWIHNKSIQKAIESYRISKEKKDYLRSLKIK